MKQDKDLNTPLHLAIRDKNFKLALDILEKGADVNLINKFEETPLLLALKMGKQHGLADMNDYKSPLSMLIVKLLELGSEVKDEMIHMIFRMYSRDINLELLKRWININVLDENGCTPLLVAVKQNKWLLASFLIENGADVNIPDSFGISPLHYATCLENADYILVQKLINAKANVNAKDKQGNSILHHMFASGQRYFMRQLVLLGADLKAINNDNKMSFELI